MMEYSNFNFDTLPMLDLGDCYPESAVSPPIFQTSTFVGGGDYSYSRCKNPTRSTLEKTLAVLEGGSHAFAFSSGLSAVTAVFSLLKNGDRVVVSDDIYGGTYRLIDEIFSRFGIEFVSVDLTDVKSTEKALSQRTAMVFCESPTNPMMKIIPIADLAEKAHSVGAKLVVDNTFLSPYFQNPLALGADISLHSATKFLSGHHDATAGAVITNDGEIATRLELISRTLGNALSPFESWLVLRGIRTLPLRMKKHGENAIRVAKFLETRPEIESVIYPALESHPGHEVCKKQSRGFGGVVTFSLRDESLLPRFLERDSLVVFAESLGGFRSLITHPLTQTHASVPPHVRKKIGITPRLLRLSVGLENADDIVASIANALESK